MADSSFRGRYRDRSASPAGRAAAVATATASKLWPFNRSRSSSPNPGSSPYEQQHDYYNAPLDYNNRSRRSSEQPPSTGSSFVIRSVVKKPGGVSLPSSPDGNAQASFAVQPQQGRGPSPGRRMAIEDSDSDDNDDPNAPSRLTYRRSRSKPLPAVMSLGVPPGGPGGGVGYGTARSFNDGRREPFHGEPAPRPKPPQQRSPSPGNITARGFQQGLQDRGRSPRTSHSPTPGRTESPSARKPVNRITPGPQSLAQAQKQTQPQQDPNRASLSSSTRPQSMAGPRQFPGSPVSNSQQARFSSSPLSAPAGSETTFGAQQATRSHARDSQVTPAFDAGSESPFGTVSPGGQSPSFLSNFMTSDSSGKEEQSATDAGGLAGKWLKGVFGRSPGDRQSYMADQRSDWARDPRPYNDGDAEEEARMQKMESMRQAQQIVEQERAREREQHRQSRPPSSPASRQLEEEFERASAEHEHERRKSPPGRKPIPALSPSAAAEPQDGLSQLQNRLTPAQMIIHETRSRQMAREQIQAEREAAIRAQRAAPPTPTKESSASPRNGEQQQRFPSGAHDIVRQTNHESTATPSRSPNAVSGTAPGPKPGDMSPGVGPMPLDMPLPQALQGMMDRFYRFERYSVPLIRCLETRLSEMERNEGLNAKRSQQPEQMRLWVGQITHLMKHEIGQLRAATYELKQGRELVADIARRHVPREAVIIAADRPQQRAVTAESSSPSPARHVSSESPSKSSFSALPEPVDRESESARSVSPSGSRPRYTSVLGQPLGSAARSPAAPTQPTSRAEAIPTESLSASSSEHSGLFKREVSVENRLKALMGTAKSTSSHSASSSVAGEDDAQMMVSRHPQRDVSEREMDMPVSLSDDSSSAHHDWTPSWQQSAMSKTEVHASLTAPALDKTPSTSSFASSSVAEPLTPLTDHAPSLAPTHIEHHDENASKEPTDYASETIRLKSFQYFDTDSVASTLSSTLKTSFDTPSASTTTTTTTMQHSVPSAPATTGISPNKLYANRFSTAASPSLNSPSSPTKMFTAQLPPVSTTAHLGLVERKRFTLPATPASPSNHGGLVQSTSFNNNSASPAAAVPLGPTSAAFSTARPIGHHATLKERVAFFDPRS